MNTGFSLIASCYDGFNLAGYREYLAFFKSAVDRFSDIRVNEVLDLGCGTGGLTALLADDGYDVAAVDGSEEMLAEAAAKCAGKNVLFTCQDMRSFELYGTVQATVCTFDCVNYLLKAEDVESCFSLVNNYTEKGGLFVFDVNSPHRYRDVYGRNSFVYDDGGKTLVWQNCYNERSGLCDFYLTLFTEAEPGAGVYIRRDGRQRQRRYPINRVRKLLEACGFDVCGVYGGLDFAPFTEGCEKAYFVAKSARGRAQG